MFKFFFGFALGMFTAQSCVAFLALKDPDFGDSVVRVWNKAYPNHTIHIS